MAQLMYTVQTLRSAVVLYVMVCQHLPVRGTLDLGCRFLQKVP